MRRLAAAAGLGAVMFFALPTVPVVACTCAVVPVGSRFASAAAVFRGTVLAVHEESGLLRATFHVTSVYKGAIGARTDVSAATTSDACGIQFAAGGRYLVFAARSGDTYSTS